MGFAVFKVGILVDVQMRGYADVRMIKCADMQICGCTNVYKNFIK